MRAGRVPRSFLNSSDFARSTHSANDAGLVEPTEGLCIHGSESSLAEFSSRASLKVYLLAKQGQIADNNQHRWLGPMVLVS